MKKIKSITLFMTGMLAGITLKYFMDRNDAGTDNSQKNRADKNASVIATLNQLFMAVQNNRDIAGYLLSKGYKNIAIYGLGNVGRRLLDILDNSEVNVLFGIDTNAENIAERVKVIHIGEIAEEPDLIIVTPIYSYEEIKTQLMEKVNCEIMSIEDILNKIETEV